LHFAQQNSWADVKTSSALNVLHEIAKTDRYDIVLWFSARDIDLLISGPKVVQPQVLSERDIAEEFNKLLGSSSHRISSKQRSKVGCRVALGSSGFATRPPNGAGSSRRSD
jgi:hypothetical protein